VCVEFEGGLVWADGRLEAVVVWQRDAVYTGLGAGGLGRKMAALQNCLSGIGLDSE
jgi:hypothetical protein